MCYAVGSLQQATSTCPMCKVFKPSASRCPHIKGICQNSTLHPRHDVMYLKNAEVQTFNGCGFCKWAKYSPSNRAGYQNPGWPGCCRPPTASEQKLIGAADWPAVSLVHHVPIPPEIKVILDGIYTGPASPRGTPPLASPPGTVRGLQAPAPGISRRASYNVASPTRTETSTPRSNPVAVPTKRGSGGSPEQVTASLSSPSRGAVGESTPSLPLNVSAVDVVLQGTRRSVMEVFVDKRPEPPNTTQNSPGCKHAELSGSIARRGSERRPSVIAATTSAPASKAPADATPQRRRPALTTTNGASQATPIRAPERSVERQADITPPKRGSTIEEVVESVEKISLSSASSSSSGSSSETTIISDGGFTDYLSDESEAELQRQAELKAAILQQNQTEELEFKAARQQLAHVDLRPPKSWRGDLQSTPRSQVQPNHNSTAYGQASYAPAYAASTASRG